MIVILHDNVKVVDIEFDAKDSQNKNNSQVFVNQPIVQAFIDIAQKYPQNLLIWAHISNKNSINKQKLNNIFSHKLIMASYGNDCIDSAMGYVEQTPFLKINKAVKYPTWVMSSQIGGIHAEVFNTLYDKSFYNINFTHFLSSIAKNAQPNGLWCYSIPDLIIEKVNEEQVNNQKIELFKFVKQHYKLQWCFILFFCLIIYEKKFPIFQLIQALFKSKILTEVDLSRFIEKSFTGPLASIDVVIPTIGRAKYLKKVFQDLANQTHVPNKVIVIEQNAIENAPTELHFIKDNSWPFKIEHQLIYQLGACNARNMALQLVESDYVFLADDDIEFDKNIIEKALSFMQANQVGATTLECLRIGDKPFFTNIFQWGTFGSGCSIVKTDFINNKFFDLNYEFGFGEDADFGMQLRNVGCDILYFPNSTIIHIKAPIGGFRTKFVHPWEKEGILPKPSPTVMLFHQTHNTTKQILGWRVIMFSKFYKKQAIKNPIKYVKNMNKRWEKSIEWANKLKN